jgi:hypothetical protein
MNTKKRWRVYPKGAPQQSIHVRSIAGYWGARRSMLTTTSHGHLGLVDLDRYPLVLGKMYVKQETLTDKNY